MASFIYVMAVFKENLPIWVPLGASLEPPSHLRPHRETLRIPSQLLQLGGEKDKQTVSQGSCGAALPPLLTHQNAVLKDALSLSHPF